MKCCLWIMLVLVFSVFVVSAQEDVSVYQGQYYENGILQEGTFLFTFDVYDQRVGGNLIYSHSEEIMTSEFGEWYVELEGISSAAQDPRKAYFMEILIDGKIQGNRRRLTQLNYVRKETNQTVVGRTVFNGSMNVTGNAYFKELLVDNKQVCLENGINCPDFFRQDFFSETDPVFSSQNKTIFEKIDNVSDRFSNYYLKSDIDKLLNNKLSLSNISNVSSVAKIPQEWIFLGGGKISVNEEKLESFIENKISEINLDNYVSNNELGNSLASIRFDMESLDTTLSDSDISSFGYIKSYVEDDPLWRSQRENYYTASQIDDLLNDKVSAPATISIADTEVEPWLPFMGEAITFNEEKLESFVETKISEINLDNYVSNNELGNSLASIRFDMESLDTTLSDSDISSFGYIKSYVEDDPLWRLEKNNYYTKEEIDSGLGNVGSTSNEVSSGTSVATLEPTNPGIGDFYYNLEKDELMFYDGNIWRKVLLENVSSEFLGSEEEVEGEIEEDDEEMVESIIVFSDGSCAYDCVYNTWGDCTQVGGELVEGTCDGGSCCKKGDSYEQCSGECLYTWEQNQCVGEIVSVEEGSCSGPQSVCCVDKKVVSGSSFEEKEEFIEMDEDKKIESSVSLENEFEANETQKIEEESGIMKENDSSEIFTEEELGNGSEEVDEGLMEEETEEIQVSEEQSLEEEVEEEVEEVEEVEEECREVCTDECSTEEVCEEVCEDIEECEEVCEPVGKSGKEKCSEECSTEEVCEEVCEDIEECEEVCEEKCGIPKQLFDISMSLDDISLENSKDLLAVVTYESFGTVPTPVNLTFEIYDSEGNLVYSKDGNIVVTVEEVRRYRFEDLNLFPGEYTFVFITVYSDNITDEFRQNFSVVKNNFFERSWGWFKGLF